MSLKKLNENKNARWRNKAFWVAIFAFFALTGQVFGFYQVPDGWDTWVKSVLTLLTAGGVIMNPTTPGIRD